MAHSEGGARVGAGRAPGSVAEDRESARRSSRTFSGILGVRSPVPRSVAQPSPTCGGVRERREAIVAGAERLLVGHAFDVAYQRSPDRFGEAADFAEIRNDDPQRRQREWEAAFARVMAIPEELAMGMALKLGESPVSRHERDLTERLINALGPARQ
jgi:hypothetical protein